MTTRNDILINTIFTGSYLNDAENIGHEIIDLFKDDSGRNFLYITHSGTIDLEKHPINSVILVRNLEKQPAVEVIAKAEFLSIPTADEISSATYAGASLLRIFRDNYYHGEKQDKDQVNITFRAEKVSFPTKNLRLILTTDKNFSLPDPTAKTIFIPTTKKSISNTSMRAFFSNSPNSANFDPHAYTELSALLSDDSLWKTPSRKLSPLGFIGASRPSFLKIIKKENDELIFSNLLSYYFSYNSQLFSHFCETVLGLPDFGDNFRIIRESNNNIDLWIEGKDKILVIENKIKSSLNGIESEDYSQLNKYEDYAESRVSDPEDSCHGKSVSYFIFTPNYNHISIEKYKLKKPYKTINYSEIYKFFAENAVSYLSEPYFPDFLSGLKNHTMSISERNFNIMESRFLEKINQIS